MGIFKKNYNQIKITFFTPIQGSYNIEGFCSFDMKNIKFEQKFRITFVYLVKLY